MDWKDVGKTIGKFAPLLGGVIGGAPGSAVGSMVASALGVENTASAVEEAIAKNPEAAAKLQELEKTHSHQWNMMLLEIQKTEIEQQALTQRKELDSEDSFVRRWRPLFGYIMAASFGFLNIALCWLIINVVRDPAGIAPTISALSEVMGPISLIWSFGMAVLGINISQRSQDKKTKMGIVPDGSGGFGGLLNVFKKG